MMSLSDLYQPGTSEKVQDLDHDLKKELDELKGAVEEFELLFQTPAKPISTVHIPKDAEHFKLERKLVISRLLQVSESQPLKLQADLMKEEMMTCDSLEYTPKSLPLLLHQYFLERIQQLIHCKYLHMLRWKRFCEHTSSIETLYPHYTKRLTRIVAEFNDCVARAKRLSAAREAFLAGSDTGMSYVKIEDLLIYLRWLTCHMYSMRTPNQFLKILHWLPILYKAETVPPSKDHEDMEDTTSASKIASRYQDDNMGGGLFQKPKPGSSSRPGSAASAQASNAVPPAPPISANLLTTSPLPSSAFTMAAAAAGGGLATDEGSLGIPLNVIDFDSLKPHLSFLLNIYGINYDLESIHTPADEMELYAAVNRKFRLLFLRQESMRTFKAYDRLEVGMENWGSDSSTHSLRQEANWVPYIRLRPEKEPIQEKKWTQLRQSNKVDEILKIKYGFLNMGEPKRVQDILRDHAAVVRDPVPVFPAYVTSNATPSGYNTAATWRKIYSNPDRYTDEDADDESRELDDKEIENVDLTQSRASSARKRKDSYDYMNTVRMLGMDDGKEDTDPATVQGAYLSFLHLRHLRLRDLHRTVLSCLNYYRSLERTLSINDAGLTQEGNDFKKTFPQNHRRSTEHDGTVGGGGGIGNHGYIHNTPADYKLNESEFIQYADVDNHDDFYTIEEGRVHVHDQRGYFIIYDAAEADLKDLEKDLLLVATHYIEKDRDFRQQSRIVRSSDSMKRRQISEMGPGDFDIASYAHQEVDRFGVLMDLWTNEAAYQECKRELLDCYIEAYQHVFDRDEKRALAQVITNLIYKRPRFDFDTTYFVKTYRTECVIMRQTTSLVKAMLDRQVEQQREYTQKVCREGDTEFGLPLCVIPKQPISVNLSRPALKNVYMLEFHTSLSMASKIPEALKYALQELIHAHRPESVYDALIIEKKMLEAANKEWSKMPRPGKSYSDQLEKDLFSEVFADDPLFMCEIAQNMVAQGAEEAQRKPAKERQALMVATVGRLMEALTYRYRLIDSAWETDILAKIYKKQAEEMGYHESHMYIRFVQFEYASYKEDAGKPPPTFMTQDQDDESAADRYVPINMFLGIHELDEGHVGRFSFRTREGVLQVMRPGGVESLSAVLKAQIVQKNALLTAVQLVDVCTPLKEPENFKSGRLSPTETKSEKSSLTQLTGFSSGTGGTALGSKGLGRTARNRPLPESFVSIKLEKTPSRDLMLNQFVHKKSQMGMLLRNVEEMEKLKRNLISEFCYMFNRRMAQFSLRGQIIAYYNSILRLLEDFPTLRNTYFMLGEPSEKKEDVDDLSGLTPDPRQRKSRPRQLLTTDGKHVLNIWFIPHHTEALSMFKKLDDADCVRALTYTVMIVSSLHDMLQYLCAHSRLGSSLARLGSRKMEFVSADWGGIEGIGSELREIQKQIDSLPNPNDPGTIAELLNLRKDVMFLEFDTAVRHCMTDTFLSTGNVQAYKSIKQNIHHALPALSNIQRPAVYSSQLTIPEPVEPRDLIARELFPYRSFLGRTGPFSLALYQFHMIEYYIQLCLAGLKEVDRHVANGEILGVTLLMEDALQSGYEDPSALADVDETESKASKKEGPGSRGGSRTGSRATSRTDVHKEPQEGVVAKIATGSNSLSRTQQPIEAYRLLKFFLMQWKCLEFLKFDWGKWRLQVEKIESPHLFKEFCKLYKTEILMPVLTSIARRLGQGEMYEGIALDTDPLVMPKGASEIEVRSKQLIKLLETYECHQIMEIRKKIAREMTLVTTERAREESALSTDLWKRPAMKESFTINKPHLTENFVDLLMSNAREGEEGKEGEVTFTSEHLNRCIMELASQVMGREKSNFESYTMYYENLMKVHHQLLYQKEQEVKQLKDQVKMYQNNVQVEVQCDLATQAHDMLMEITALRAKIFEMRQTSLNQEAEIRDKVKKEYNDLVGNMMEACDHIKAKFDEFRHELHDDVNDMITDTRRETLRSMESVKQKTMADAGLKQPEYEELIQRNLAKSEQIRELKNENHNLNVLVLKIKAMNNWRQNHTNLRFVKTINQLKMDANHSKKEYVQIKMKADEKVILLRQQLSAIRKALTSTEKECNEIRKQLDKELKEKLEKTHEEMQRAASQKQLEMAKQANIEKLIDELDYKDTRLKTMLDVQEKNTKFQIIQQEKVRKDVDCIRKQLSHERGLKLDAFNRVDELQTHVYDIESAFMTRTQSAITARPQSPAQTVKSNNSKRAQSAYGTARSRMSSRGTPTSSGVWPPPVSWPAGHRSMTAVPPSTHDYNNLDKKSIQRPKTVHSRLRSRIAEQLMNELELDNDNTIIQLEKLQLDSGRPKETAY
ncbi:uncharacterized protein LOC110457263 isoform X2 [Mizuhopecten yessoensis]|uniref:uncharacterized protein LOC110457263 isoform X2 n=1 Tax=Mizuhopecten yessoensis TaxID=6573 RepID=UPI000B457528|nr:uncharacterized protein LOC110457263 isoform X2 [Mizuhopecten yessoensis]